VEGLTTSFLNEFKLYLQKEGCHQNYVYVNLKALRIIIQKDAIREDKILPPEKNPFLRFTLPELLPAYKEKLDINEIDKIEALQLQKDTFLYHVRNAFIFSLYNAGIRIGDLLQLRWCNVKEDGRLEYYPGKTGKERSIKLLLQPLKILRLYYSEDAKETDYIFPFLDSNSNHSGMVFPEDFQRASPELLELLYKKIESQVSMFNQALKTIARKAEIKKNITSRISRHSFADIARKKNISVYDIQKMLGHSSVKITEAYLKSLDNDVTDKAMSEVFHQSPFL
jgi:integrase